MDKREGYMEGSIYNSGRGVWTYSDILWTHKFPGNVSNDNE